MSVLKDVLDGVRQVLVLTDEVRRNATAVSALAIDFCFVFVLLMIP